MKTELAQLMTEAKSIMILAYKKIVKLQNEMSGRSTSKWKMLDYVQPNEVTAAKILEDWLSD